MFFLGSWFTIIGLWFDLKSYYQPKLMEGWVNKEMLVDCYFGLSYWYTVCRETSSVLEKEKNFLQVWTNPGNVSRDVGYAYFMRIQKNTKILWERKEENTIFGYYFNDSNRNLWLNVFEAYVIHNFSAIRILLKTNQIF